MKLLALLCGLAALLVPHTAPAQASGTEIIIEAFVDGPSTLHLTPEGLYWTNGNNSKPGRWHGAAEPTYVNGTAWKPVWGKPDQDTGPDKSEIYPLKFGTIEVNFRLLAVGQMRDQKGKEKRTPCVAKKDGGEFVVLIPDPESQPRWYKFSLTKR